MSTTEESKTVADGSIGEGMKKNMRLCGKQK